MGRDSETKMIVESKRMLGVEVVPQLRIESGRSYQSRGKDRLVVKIELS